MSKGEWRFSQNEVRRAIKAVIAMGLPINAIEIAKDGSIKVAIGQPIVVEPNNPWDEVLGNAAHEKRTS